MDKTEVVQKPSSSGTSAGFPRGATSPNSMPPGPLRLRDLQPGKLLPDSHSCVALSSAEQMRKR